jgi:hypothetical protein
VSENIILILELILVSKLTVVNNVKVKATPVTGREDPYSCETLRLPHFLNNRLTKGGEDFNFTCRPPFTPQEDFWYSFLLEAESTPGL